jgi:hypothetical protein
MGQVLWGYQTCVQAAGTMPAPRWESWSLASPQSTLASRTKAGAAVRSEPVTLQPQTVVQHTQPQELTWFLRIFT